MDTYKIAFLKNNLFTVISSDLSKSGNGNTSTKLRMHVGFSILFRFDAMILKIQVVTLNTPAGLWCEL